MGTTATGRELRQDLFLGLRLALPCSRAEALRSSIVVAGVAACVAVLLVLAALPGALGARDARLIAMTPAPVPPTAGATPPGWVVDGQFFAAQWEIATVNGPVLGIDLFAPDPVAFPAPPGVTWFPRPGEVWVSPALARLLAESPSTAPFLGGTVVGTIAPDGLVGPDELRFYRGTATPTLPSADGPTLAIAAAGWGHPTVDWETRFDSADRPMTVLLLAGGTVAVLVVAGLLVLLAQLDGVTGVRGTVGLRLLELPTVRLRRIGAIRGLVHGLLAVALGAVGFAVLRAHATGLPLGRGAFFPADLTVPSSAAALVTVVVTALLVTRHVRPAARTALVIDERVPPRPYGAQVIVLLTAAAALAMTASGDQGLRGRLAMGTATLAVVAVLGVVAVLVPWLVDVIVSRPTVSGDPRVRRAVSRPFGAAAGLLTAVLVLQAVSQADGPDGGTLLGSRADLVATAPTAIRAAAIGMLLLAIVGTLLAAERARRSELMPAVLLPTVLGSALAVPVAVALTWMLAQLTDLRMSALSVPTLAWAGGSVLFAAILAAAIGSGPAADQPPGSSE